MERRSYRGILPFLLLLLLLSLLSIRTASASRFLAAPREGREEAKIQEFSHVVPAGMLEGGDSWNLIGLEACTARDEECMKRRMISEAHLDYIYTQHLKP